MSHLKASLRQLEMRLPELAWKLSVLQELPKPHQLPPGLFKDRMDATAQSFIDDIQADLLILKQKENEQSAYYLAQKVSQKINVLVHFCQKNTLNLKNTSMPLSGIESLVTRQQWLQGLHAELQQLDRQRLALNASLQRALSEQKQEAILNIQSQLGEVERRYTEVQEKIG